MTFAKILNVQLDTFQPNGNNRRDGKLPRYSMTKGKNYSPVYGAC